MNSIDEYNALVLTGFRVLTRFELTQALEPGEPPIISLLLELQNEKTLDCFRVRCTGVQSLSLAQPNLSLFTLSQLEVRDISADQWEGIRLAVKDVEDQGVAFICADFAFELIVNG